MKLNKKGEFLQKEYYIKSASDYDNMHVDVNDEHYFSLKNILLFNQLLHPQSILDLGCGTGRGVQFFLDNYSDLKIFGIEPIKPLINQGLSKGIPNSVFILGDGKFLPLKDNSIDVVCEFGVLHHVKDPNAVVKEMIRIAKKAIFISDSNRFGQGKIFFRYIKLLAYKFNLWDFFYFLFTKGKGYQFSDGDGISYSYSVYDSYDLLAKWADRIIFIPTINSKGIVNWNHPLSTSEHILMCALKNDKEDC